MRVEDGPGWSLGHARLSIIDLEGGWQPLHAAGSTVIGNGEIYNYVELTLEHQLQKALATGSDFEPLLHLYARQGAEAFERLRGMFAFCLIGADGRRWLIRDGFGIKPLYYTGDEARLTFASEPRALLGTAVPRAGVDPARAEELLALGYTLGETTIFPGDQAAGARRLALPSTRRRAPRPRATSTSTGSRPRPSPSPTTTRRWRRWTGSWRTACGCTSARTCPTACSCRAGSTPPRLRS